MADQKKVNVGLIQINNSFNAQNYFPYAMGVLQAYALRHAEGIDRFNFMTPLYKREPVVKAVSQLDGADLAFFSSYVWNLNVSTSIAKKLKEQNPNTTVVFGGPHVPEKGLEKFMHDHPYIDLAITGEGEIPFKSVLENYHNRDWYKVPSTTFRKDGKPNGQLITNLPAARIEDLNDVPSPYLTGLFDQLIKDNPKENWIGLWETNRGCPFSCTYCDWGVGAKKRMADFNMDRLFKEIDWFGANKIPFIYCCDANFGMFKDRDIPIAEKMAETKARTGYPVAFSVQNTKNSTENSYKVQTILNKAGLSRGVLLAFQSADKEVLKAIKRGNIRGDVYEQLQRRFNSDRIETFSDIILGLPEETYDKYVDGISTLVARGQHNRMQFNNLSILPNAEMGDPAYQEKYGLIVVDSKIINMHGSLNETEEISETQRLVVGTKAMPKEDWVKARTFSYTASLLHFNKMLQLPFVLANYHYGINFRNLIEKFTQIKKEDSPVIAGINEFFINQAREVQKGGPEYSESKEWLNIWWYPDELAMIKLVTENKLNDFYIEAGHALDEILSEHGIADNGAMLDALHLNRELIKTPFQTADLTLDLGHNVWEAYIAGLTDEKINDQKISIEQGEFRYKIDRTTKSWQTLEDWCEKAIWWGNKKGAYLFPCEPIEVKEKEHHADPKEVEEHGKPKGLVNLGLGKSQK